MLDIRFFKNPRFSAASATITLTYFALFGSTFLLTQYFQFVLGYTPLKAGMMTAPVAIGIMVCAPRRHRSSWSGSARSGSSSADCRSSCSACVCTRRTRSCRRSSLGAVVADPVRRRHGLHVAPATESIMGSLPPGKAGVGSAVNDTTRQTGGALGVAVIGSVFAARFHSVVGAATDVPESARGAVRDSIGAALDAARGLPASQQALIRDVVDHAYIVSMRLAYGLAATVVLLAAAVTWRYLPAHVPDEIEVEQPEEEVRERVSVPA